MLRSLDHGPVRELRLERPPANALAPELVDALAAAVRAAPANGAEALVLSGAPGMFSAGLDVPYLLTLDRQGIAAAWAGFYDLLRALAAAPVPIAAAITGHSPAGGAVLAILCDRRVMAEGPWAIGLNEVKVGIPLPPALFGALRRVVGHRTAERLAVAGAMVAPDEALAIGLVDELAPPAEVVDRALQWCGTLLALPRGPMLRTRRRARRDLQELLRPGDGSEVEGLVDDWFDDETQAALHALVERLAAKRADKEAT
ncbi:MAG: enoyl-CoA hydratase/isomerase family protein [Thermoanaerobaculia bacterium]